jgi:hypothetical protein
MSSITNILDIQNKIDTFHQSILIRENQKIQLLINKIIIDEDNKMRNTNSGILNIIGSNSDRIGLVPYVKQSDSIMNDLNNSNEHIAEININKNEMNEISDTFKNGQILLTERESLIASEASSDQKDIQTVILHPPEIEFLTVRPERKNKFSRLTSQLKKALLNKNSDFKEDIDKYNDEIMNSSNFSDRCRRLQRVPNVYDSYSESEGIEEVISDRYIIYPKGYFHRILEFLILWSTIYALVFTPINIAGVGVNDYILFSMYEITIDLLYIIDFISSFFTAYYDEEENLVICKNKILSHYINGWFFLDLLTSIPVYTYLQSI